MSMSLVVVEQGPDEAPCRDCDRWNCNEMQVFVLENLSLDIILGRPWERMVRAKHDNRDTAAVIPLFTMGMKMG